MAQAKGAYEKLARSSFDLRKCVIDLQDYTRFHRAKILYNHVWFANIGPAYRAVLLDSKSYMKIVDHPNYNPRIIEWMTDYLEQQGIEPGNYVSAFLSSLDNPAKVWLHAFEKQLSNAGRHVLLVLVTLPEEVLFEDLERAFMSFYGLRGREHGFPIDLRDFREALKELEGNFIEINKYNSGLVVKFHNPSILDFLVNYLVENPDFAAELLSSAIFFEQISRLWGNPLDGWGVPRTRKLTQDFSDTLAEAVKRLLHADDCRLITVRVYQPKLCIDKHREFVPLETRAVTALDIAHQLGVTDLAQFTFARLEEHLARGVDKAALDVLINQMRRKKMSVPPGVLEAMKMRLLERLDDLDDYEVLCDLVNYSSGCLSEEEWEDVKEKFVSSYDGIVDSTYDGVSEPDEIRRVADQLDSIGGQFDLDVGQDCERLRDHAAEMEGENSSGDDDYAGSWKDYAEAHHRTEEEIHAMFDSLRG
ncbi:MAG: hypothetical protein HY914_01940 [Desulfomonile tiedjei]|nr:hypothetical protein [Desulfomonile tiedjei]